MKDDLPLELKAEEKSATPFATSKMTDYSTTKYNTIKYNTIQWTIFIHGGN